jgi:hypothetical protein
MTVELVLGSPEHAFRQSLAAVIQRLPGLVVVGASGDA